MRKYRKNTPTANAGQKPEGPKQHTATQGPKVLEPSDIPRDYIIDTLGSMNIFISKDSRLKKDRLRHRLEKGLDASQRYTGIFGDAKAVVNPPDYPAWPDNQDLEAAMDRRVWGGFMKHEEDQPVGFMRLRELILSLVKAQKQGKHTVIFAEGSTALIVKMLGICAPKVTRPLIVVGYMSVSGTKQVNLADLLKRLIPEDQQSSVTRVFTTTSEQNLFWHLLNQNGNRLPPSFQPEGLGEGYQAGFVLPICQLSMEDVGRLNKSEGCVMCGNPSRAVCTRCMDTDYCMCQKEHWKEHKVLCRSISELPWMMVTLQPSLHAFVTGINRYYDLDDGLKTTQSDSQPSAPLNIHGEKYHLLKLQLSLGNIDDPHFLVYDRYRSFQLLFRPDDNHLTFAIAVQAMDGYPKMYRWAKREGDWDWSICFALGPDKDPRW
ncbi:hypothetical protein P691DRAFT_775533 [Macrolepiota fuliginosa MF-IS2]|uniref:MYND-type domain-containing protein n=1 Tax=Macrolepiota fuliginosa MF-IS2 TaxID=1400762 RepID=A0A9P6C4A6_9AGAR|nr:hypothetical protein P691DRAFT_775533 [Macrolepiota fuliginosa MF-IS2]